MVARVIYSANPTARSTRYVHNSIYNCVHDWEIIMLHVQKILLLTGCLLLSANLFADESFINISNGWVRATPPGVQNAAAFFTLNNTGNVAKKLTGVQCPITVASRCEVHEHLHTENGGMLMQKVTAPLSIPANDKLVF